MSLPQVEHQVLFMKNYTRKVCRDCKLRFIPVSGNQKFCGSNTLKIGCSYKEGLKANNRGRKNWPSYFNRETSAEAHKRLRAELIISRGSKCEHCGIKKDNFSFFDLDHMTPIRSRKRRILSSRRNFPKLQVLCPNCHRLKTMEEGVK